MIRSETKDKVNALTSANIESSSEELKYSIFFVAGFKYISLKGSYQEYWDAASNAL